ncbi:MAG: hypothetical protein JNL48_10555 [Acidobacteria bacterium]|nr:hypothetical protein [Acidobacteriota bacterium]
MHTTARLTTAAVLLAATTTATAAPGKASGYFRLDKTRSEFTNGCAFRLPDPSGATAGVTHVILSDKPLDCDAADQTFDPVEAAKAQVKAQKPAFVTFTLPAGSTVDRIDGGWESTAPEDGFSFGGQGKVAIKVNTADRVTGRYFLDKPSDFFDKTFQFDFTWDAPVLAGSMSGTALPAGGGDVGAAYQKYVAAIGKGDLAAIRTTVTAAKAADVPALRGAEAKKLVELMQLFELKTATVTSGVQRGDQAALLVKGVGFDKAPGEGRVIMQREGGAWKVARVIMKSPF